MTDIRTYNPDIFDERHWRTPLSLTERERLAATAAAVPLDVSSLLDVGCGDGRLLALLAQERRLEYLVGLDTSVPGLLRVPTVKVVGSCVRLPFADRSFEIVTCCEVLEHLPDGALEETIAEVSRVAGRYLLVSVPREEQCEVCWTRCRECGAVFHVDGHLRSFDSARLLDLLPRWEIVRNDEVLPRTRRAYSPSLLRIKQQIFGCWAWSEAMRCPRCGSTSMPRDNRRWARAAIGALNAVARPRKTAGGWLVVVLRRAARTL